MLNVIELIDLDKVDNDDTVSEESLNDSSDIRDTSDKKIGSNFSKMFGRFSFFIVVFLLLEIVFHVWAFKKCDAYFGEIVAVIACNAMICTLFSSFFPKVFNKIMTGLITFTVSIYFVVNILYYSVFQVFFSVALIDKTNMKVVEYNREIFTAFMNNFVVILITLLVPAILYVISLKVKIFCYERVKLFMLPVNIGFFAVTVFILYGVTLLYGKETFSPYSQIFYQSTSEVSVDRLGVIGNFETEIIDTIVHKDIFPEEAFEEPEKVWVDDRKTEETVSGNNIEDPKDYEAPSDESKVDIIQPEEKVIDTSPNILDLDFVAMKEKETDEFVAGISNYLSTVEPSYKNEYTGMFEGYNLIFLTAEAFSTWAVDEKLTPTLYRLTHEGIVCNNFYNPRTGGSTSDGEFVNCTSLYPVCGSAKNFKIVGQNSMPFSLGNMFNRKYNITSRAYHDNDYTYYGRDISYPSMGYYYQGMGNGLEIENHWPASDLQMIESTVDEYIDDDIFHVYYMTVSGHLNYEFSGNWCSKLHKDEVMDLPYSTPCKAYLACNIELDRALEYLIKKLEEKGIADKTVICFTGDHWPYGLTNEEISELAGHEVEENFELFKSSLVLWSESIKEPIYVDKQCSSMDILPTLLNLFGFDYDSRLLMGRDIMSDTEGFVMFINRSFITDKVMYNSLTKDITYLTDEPVDDEYISTQKKKLNNRWKYSERIMTYDYYKYICDELGIEIPFVEQNYVPDYSKFTP